MTKPFLNLKVEKSLHEMNVGDIIHQDMMNGVLKAPIRLAKITYTLIASNGCTMDIEETPKGTTPAEPEEEDTPP